MSKKYENAYSFPLLFKYFGIWASVLGVEKHIFKSFWAIMDQSSVLKLFGLFQKYVSEALLDVEQCQNSQIMYCLVEVTVTEVSENGQYL